MKKSKRSKKSQIFLIISLLILLFVITFATEGTTNLIKGSISYVDFMQDVSDDEIESVTLNGSTLIKVTYKEGKGLDERLDEDGNAIKPELKDGKRIETVVDVKGENFLRSLSEKNIVVQYETPTTMVTIFSLILMNIPLILMILLLYFYITKIFGSIGNKESKGELNVSRPMTLFTDVAGMTEEKEEMLFAINSLKDIDKYVKMGVKPIRGILLEGPPGVGKTLLAKAVAGEAGVNFLSYSGSDFVEMFAGLGAQRVRSMYKKAEELKPCVIFIDEIDALGRKRLQGSSGGHQEADQTLVALLERMDGMNTTSGILFIGATNRADALDSALLRPGRFDKIIHIGPPKTKEDREAIVRVHSQDKSFGEGVTVEKIAKQCYGLTGAEIASALNDAVLESFKDKREGIITLGDIDKAVMKLMAKGLAKGRHSEEDRYRVAVHEVGHALMNKEIGRDVVKVSIQPYSSGVGGVTMIDGESKGVDGLRKASDLRNDIKVLYAGKVAEEVILGEGSVGASNDLERATYLLRDYIGAYGLQAGTILSLVGLARENMMITANEELLKKMEKEGQILYKEVLDYFKKDEIQEILHKIVEKLMVEEVVYDIDDI